MCSVIPRENQEDFPCTEVNFQMWGIVSQIVLYGVLRVSSVPFFHSATRANFSRRDVETAVLL